jgi:serine/threonine-protein kinase CTR1
MGVILWELVQRREPYKKMQPLQVISAVVFQGQRLPQPKDCDPELVALIDRCWAADSTVRPSFYAIQEMLQEVFARYIQSAQTQKTVVQVGSSQ